MDTETQTLKLFRTKRISILAKQSKLHGNDAQPTETHGTWASPGVFCHHGTTVPCVACGHDNLINLRCPSTSRIAASKPTAFFWGAPAPQPACMEAAASQTLAKVPDVALNPRSEYYIPAKGKLRFNAEGL